MFAWRVGGGGSFTVTGRSSTKTYHFEFLIGGRFYEPKISFSNLMDRKQYTLLSPGKKKKKKKKPFVT